MTNDEIMKETLNETLHRAKRRLAVIKQVHDCPIVYALAVGEVLRRRLFRDEFTSVTKSLVENSKILRDEELRIRRLFSRQMDGHFLRCLFNGLDGKVPNFCAESILPFDEDLPVVEIQNVRELRAMVPQIAQYLQTFGKNRIFSFHDTAKILVPLHVAKPQVFQRMNVMDQQQLTETTSRLKREASFLVHSPKFSIPGGGGNFFSLSQSAAAGPCSLSSFGGSNTSLNSAQQRRQFYCQSPNWVTTTDEDSSSYCSPSGGGGFGSSGGGFSARHRRSKGQLDLEDLDETKEASHAEVQLNDQLYKIDDAQNGGTIAIEECAFSSGTPRSAPIDIPAVGSAGRRFVGQSPIKQRTAGVDEAVRVCTPNSNASLEELTFPPMELSQHENSQAHTPVNNCSVGGTAVRTFGSPLAVRHKPSFRATFSSASLSNLTPLGEEESPENKFADHHSNHHQCKNKIEEQAKLLEEFREREVEARRLESELREKLIHLESENASNIRRNEQLCNDAKSLRKVLSALRPDLNEMKNDVLNERETLEKMTLELKDKLNQLLGETQARFDSEKNEYVEKLLEAEKTSQEKDEVISTLKQTIVAKENEYQNSLDENRQEIMKNMLLNHEIELDRERQRFKVELNNLENHIRFLTTELKQKNDHLCRENCQRRKNRWSSMDFSTKAQNFHDKNSMETFKMLKIECEKHFETKFRQETEDLKIELDLAMQSLKEYREKVSEKIDQSTQSDVDKSVNVEDRSFIRRDIDTQTSDDCDVSPESEFSEQENLPVTSAVDENGATNTEEFSDQPAPTDFSDPKILDKSTQTKLSHPHLSVLRIRKGDLVLVTFDFSINAFVVFTVSNSVLYILKESCVVKLGLQKPPQITGMESPRLDTVPEELVKRQMSLPSPNSAHPPPFPMPPTRRERRES
uniref:Uncharacterized protein n=1 Tax=Romanomermis culicivorax TaxID=13658 RepID=A0A915J2V7_ROMCU